MKRRLRRIMPISINLRPVSVAPRIIKKKVFVESVPEIKRVGKYYAGKKRPFSYFDVKYDENKWADATLYLPIEFDLCHCKTKDKTVPGWYTGHCWDGSKIKPDDKVLFWKCNYNF